MQMPMERDQSNRRAALRRVKGIPATLRRALLGRDPSWFTEPMHEITVSRSSNRNRNRLQGVTIAITITITITEGGGTNRQCAAPGICAVFSLSMRLN